MLIPKPGSITEPTHQNPRELLIFAQTKTGKTSLINGLENHLLLDTENGSEFVSGTKINILEKASEINAKRKKENKDEIQPYQLMEQIANEIKAVNEKAGKKVYDYIVLDTVTLLEEMAKELAADDYKSTPMGKAFKGNGNDIINLPMGKGYGLTRTAFIKLLAPFKVLPAKALILFGHVKNASINKEGKDLSAKDINLTGALKTIVAAEADAIGYMFRDKGTNKNIISFKTHEQDLASGARPPHLRGQEFVISEMNDKGEIITYWDKIFLPEQ